MEGEVYFLEKMSTQASETRVNSVLQRISFYYGYFCFVFHFHLNLGGVWFDFVLCYSKIRFIFFSLCFLFIPNSYLALGVYTFKSFFFLI